MNVDALVSMALKEDGVFNDITTKSLIPKNKTAAAVLIANKPGVLCGLGVFIKVFKAIDKRCEVKTKMRDCAKLKKGARILEVTGPADAILSGERTALNFIQHLSGIATITNEFVLSAKNGKTKIYDTRKTIPGYRELAKYAVRCGKGTNHRMGLSDMILIKDNHLRFISDLSAKTRELKAKYKNMPIEVECERPAQVKQALKARADIIMLDNMSFPVTKKMVSFIRQNSSKTYKPEIEISGSVNLKTAKKFAKLAIERISIGKITHSAQALDMALEITVN